MKKNIEFEFVLKDSEDFVQAILTDGKKMVLKYENVEAKAIRVRVGLPTKEEIIAIAKLHVAENLTETIEDDISYYIRCREMDIFNQMQEIRKCIKRIRQYKKCERIAWEALEEYRQYP